MANDDKAGTPERGAAGTASSPSTPARPTVTRRDFLIRGNAGAVAIGVMTGAGLASGLVQLDAQTPPPAGAPPVAKRRVTLDIDGRAYDVNVDVRESLWETLNHQLGLSSVNLGCDRAQCGACTVLVDGRPVNGCSQLTARLGRGQKIRTVAGIAPGPGLDGLHPVQRAFWFEGGFQCGVCTRGFVMTSYALLQTNSQPSELQIREALAGNICRCGEYPKIVSAVTKAAAELRGERVVYTAPFVIAAAAAGASAAPVAAASKQFEFVAPLGTIEVFDDLAAELRRQPGILGVSGSERTATITWDPGKLDEAGVRRILAAAGNAVKP